MIIRSQDKESIINFDAVDTLRLSRISEVGVIQEEYQTSILYDANDTFGVLGTYSTEEKAIKVLDMIQNKYLNCNRESMAGCFGFVKNTVFQMPKDEEV